ncbi:MAG: Asp-tRNA(Asn)/Glu-tRNA(Gln) amidotransferase subunit GatA, partial [Rhodobiaceae bacterium]|nr:Asp-tRNA(Asn)/Glu-tRNA(Gln) amidotransferase subunit GatA [Rhodobiaceae bacterium]
MIDIKNLNLKQIRDGLQNKSFKAIELTETYLNEIDKAKALNAFITVTPDKAISMAKESDNRISKNESRNLEGIPLSIKDLYCTKNVRTTAGSKILKNFIPTYESTITNNLWSDGCVMLGKLNNDEFAMGSSNETSYFGPSINPWKRKNDDMPLVPGGSSGGSAVAVSGSLSAATTATDTGGSIRQPASFTGTVGMKATYGRCSRWGVVAFASSLDQAGPITKTVVDSAIMLKSMAGYDVKDSTSIDLSVPDYETNINKNI